MKVLVTGGAGLIGMALRRLLPTQGHAVVAIDREHYGRDDLALHELDLGDVHGLHALAGRHDFDGVAHCGAISGPMMSRGRPMDIVGANIVGTGNVLQLARIAGVRRVVFCSSISVYGSVGGATLVEEMPLHPSSVYAASKAAGEHLVEAFAREYGLDGVSLRIGRVYGPYRRGDCVIKAMIEASRAGRRIAIPCAPDFVYHYVWVDDVARAIAAALTAPLLPSRAYNVGADEAATMPEIVALARQALPGLQAEVVAGADDVPDVQTRFDVSRIAADLGFRPSMRLAAGIPAYAAALPEATVIPA